MISIFGSKKGVFFGIFVLAVALILGGGVFVTKDKELGGGMRFALAYRLASQEEKRAVFEDHVDTLGASVMLDVLEREFPGCHAEAHDLGRVVLQTSHDVHEALETCAQRCTGGCFHGILFELFGRDEHLEFEDLRGRLEEICRDESIVDYVNEGNCMHAMGHVLTNLSGYNLEQALGQCATLEDVRLEFWCATGVFMEYSFSDFAADDFAKGRIHYPCDTYTKFPAACYRYQTARIFEARERSLEATSQECTGLEDRYARLGCFHGLGFAYYGDILRRPETLAGVCRFGTTDDQTVCIEGVVEFLGSNFKEIGLAACDSLTGEMHEVCTQALERGNSSLDKPFDLYIRE